MPTCPVCTFKNFPSLFCPLSASEESPLLLCSHTYRLLSQLPDRDSSLFLLCQFGAVLMYCDFFKVFACREAIFACPGGPYRCLGKGSRYYAVDIVSWYLPRSGHEMLNLGWLKAGVTNKARTTPALEDLRQQLATQQALRRHHHKFLPLHFSTVFLICAPAASQETRDRHSPPSSSSKSTHHCIQDFGSSGPEQSGEENTHWQPAL